MATLAAADPRTVVRGRELPPWPVYLLLIGFPVWWVLGLGTFAVFLCSLPMIGHLVVRRRVEFPTGFALYVCFLSWTLVSATQLDAHALVGFAVRFGTMFGAGVLFVYVYNARSGLPTRKMFVALGTFLAFVVFGGYLGVLLPHGSITTLTQRLLPTSIVSNSYVYALVHPAFAEVQQPYGSPVAFYRPSAPFPYTNSWGCTLSLLVPLAIAAFGYLHTQAGKIALAVVLLLAAVPALESLNRGLYLGLAVAVAYVAVRLAARGRIVPLGGLILAALAAYGVAFATGFVAELSQRLAYSESNTSRTTVYAESIRGALAAPWFGNGAPQPSDTVAVAVGSQGQVWYLMFSYGFVALGLFVLWFFYAWWVGRRCGPPAELWISATLLVTLVSLVYYGYDGPQLAVAMCAAALLLRRPAA